MWPWLTILAVATAIALHLWWSARFRRAQAAGASRVKELEVLQERAGQQRQKQLSALFDSMVEGVLLLDAADRIELANPAFLSLFGVLAGGFRRSVGTVWMISLSAHQEKNGRM